MENENEKPNSSTFENLHDSTQPLKPTQALVSQAVSEMEKKKASTFEDLHDTTQPLQQTMPFNAETEETSQTTIAGDFTDKSSAEKRASQSSSNEHIQFSPLLIGANIATHSIQELEIHGDNISCVGRSEGTNVATGENGDRDRFPVNEKVVTRTSFDKAGGNHYDVPNLTEELPPVEGEPFKCSSHSSQKNHLLQCVPLIKNTRIQESQQSQPGNPSDVSDSMDDSVQICDTCGDVGVESLLVSCNKCPDGAEHTYCMRVKLFEKPKSWTCQDCAPREGTNELVQDDVEVGARRKNLTKRSRNRESSKGAKFSSRSSYPRKSSTKGVSSKTHLLAKRHEAPLEAPTAQKVSSIETRAVSSRSSEPCKNSMLSEDFSCEQSQNVMTKSVDIVYSVPPSSDEGEKVPRACGDKKGLIDGSPNLDSQTGIAQNKCSLPPTSLPASDSAVTAEKNEKEMISGGETLVDAYELNNLPMSLPAYDSAVTAEKIEKETVSGGETLAEAYEINDPPMSLSASDSAVTAENIEKETVSGGETLFLGSSLQIQKVERNLIFHDDRKGKGPIVVSESMISECAFSEESNATGSKVVVADACEPNNPSMSTLASDSAVTAENNEKEIISGGETLFLGSRFCGLDAVGSSQKLEPATVLQGFVIPNPHHSWIGKFLIHNSEGIARNCDGFQAHLSSCAPPKVLQVVGRLPEIIILEEVPRLRIWPSQFMGSQVTEENIALYFFAKDDDSYETHYKELVNRMMNNDLALKGNLDGDELLIFPSNILPERSQCWNQMKFLWGVFNEQMVNNSANTTVSNSVQQGNGDTVKRRNIDLNAYPEDEDEDAGVNLDVQQGNGDIVTRGTTELNVCIEDENVEADVNLAVQGRSTTPENGSVRIEHHVKEPPTSL